jgi:TRAP-type C4-dicarboxylate transport system substrate-binding protein
MVKHLLLVVIWITAFAALLLFYMPSFAVGKVIRITFNDHNPKMSEPAQAVSHWAQKVEEACSGGVVVKVHYGDVLLKGDEVYRGTQNRLPVDIHERINSVIRDGTNHIVSHE